MAHNLQKGGGASASKTDRMPGIPMTQSPLERVNLQVSMTTTYLDEARSTPRPTFHHARIDQVFIRPFLAPNAFRSKSLHMVSQHIATYIRWSSCRLQQSLAHTSSSNTNYGLGGLSNGAAALARKQTTGEILRRGLKALYMRTFPLHTFSDP